MKLKVIYTGNPVETRVVNAETDEPVEGVDSVEISIDAFGGHSSPRLQTGSRSTTTSRNL